MKRERGRAARAQRKPGPTGGRGARKRAQEPQDIAAVLEHRETPEGRRRVLEQMQLAWLTFYGQAARIGCHAFLEFSGLMTKFIDLCRAAEARGEPWLRANVHSGQHLAFAEHDVDYLLEKLECIYGMHFQLVPRAPAAAASVEPRARPRRRTEAR